MKVILTFFISLGVSFAGLFGYLTLTSSPKPEVLSSEIQASPSETPQTAFALTTPSPIATPTDTPTASPSASPTKTPSPTKTASPKPTIVPTKTPSATPSPTKTPSPTPTKSPTPTPTPTTTASPTTSPSSTPIVSAPANMEPIFVQYAAQYSIDKNVLETIAKCESNFNSNAANGDYLGIFQFSASKWTSMRTQMNQDINVSLRTNTEESIKTASFTISKEGTSPWPNCI